MIQIIEYERKFTKFKSAFVELNGLRLVIIIFILRSIVNFFRCVKFGLLKNGYARKRHEAKESN